ncbi:MAG: efflux RND transporter periplasmic adaptor subunit [Bacteroidales bacterium]|nr:efflux RND transporter periplasmic adaptor subunit [Bacteroidales bacterium]
MKRLKTILMKARSLPRRWKWLSCTLVLAMLILSIRACGSGGGGVKVETALPLRLDLVETVPATGTIQPVVEVKVSPDVSGEIVELCVKEGDRVEAGDLVLRIRSDLYLSQVDQARASLGTLRSQYLQQRAEARQARLDHERDRKLYELNAISAAEFQSSATSLEIAANALRAAEYAVRSGEARLKEAQENLQKTTIYAPMSGVVSRLSVEKGERVVGTSQMPGTELLRIADFSRMEVVVDVGESDIVRIEPGDSVTVEVDAFPHRKFGGRVTSTANSAKNLDVRFDQVTNFGVRIELLPDSVRFLPGMSASVSIETDHRHDALTIPVESVFTRGKEEFVWLAGDGRKAVARSITTGIQQQDRIEVLSGLSDGELIVTGPPEAVNGGIQEGAALRISGETASRSR